MLSLRIHGKLDMRVEETDIPEPGKDEVRLRVAYVGVCGSDMHYYFDGANGAFVVREPLVPGHELAATVDLDPGDLYEVGTPVTVHPATFGDPVPGLEESPHLWPGGAYLGSASTWPHTQGAASQYLIVRRSMVRRLPAELSLRRAALAEPLAVALHAVNLAGGVVGKRVLVSGAGPIGLLGAAAALASGAVEVIVSDVLPGPLSRARSLGVTRTVQVGAEELPNESVDVVLECSGAPAAVSAAIAAVRRAGTVVQVGMMSAAAQPVALAPLVAKEVTMVGSFRFHDEIDEAVRLLARDDRFDSVITHVMPATDGRLAFEAAADSESSGKVLIDVASMAAHPAAG